MANTEINYVKKKIKQLEEDIATFGRLLLDAGIVEIQHDGKEFVYQVHKVKLDDEQPEIQQD